MPGEKMPETERREAILAGAYRVAARDTLGGLSIRAVAEEAGVSKGLVFFHFQDKETLLFALLDWMLDYGPRVEVPDHLPPPGTVHPAARLLVLLGHQVELLEERRERLETFLDFWVMGSSVPEIRERIHEGFERYRLEFVPYTTEVVAALPVRFQDTDPEALAAAVVSFIEGCSLQLIGNPEAFDVGRYMGAVHALVIGR